MALPTTPPRAPFARALLVLSVLAGCGERPSAGDASLADAALDGPAESARVSVTLEVDPESLEDDTTLERLVLGVREVRAANDRADVVARVERPIDLGTGSADVMLTTATPGVYGEVEVELVRGEWGPSLELVLAEPDRLVELVLDQPLEIEGRCSAPVELVAGGTLGFRARLDLASVAHVLRERELPAAIDGVIHVDAESAPEVVSEVIEELRRLEVACDEDDDG